MRATEGKGRVNRIAGEDEALPPSSVKLYYFLFRHSHGGTG